MGLFSGLADVDGKVLGVLDEVVFDLGIRKLAPAIREGAALALHEILFECERRHLIKPETRQAGEKTIEEALGRVVGGR